MLRERDREGDKTGVCRQAGHAVTHFVRGAAAVVAAVAAVVCISLQVRGAEGGGTGGPCPWRRHLVTG